MRGVLATALLAMILLSGCAEDAPSGDDDGASGSLSASATGTTSGPAANATLAAAHLGANVTTGPAPLSANFTLNGTGTSWTLSFGDGSPAANGTTLPSTLVHEFTVAGEYVVVLNVSSGGSHALSNVTVNVTAPAPAGTPFSVDLATTLPCTDCYFSPLATGNCVEFTLGEPKGLRCDWAELPADAGGRSFLLTTTGSDPGLEFFDACSGTATSLGTQDETAADETGTVPAGALCVVVYEFEATSAGFTFALV